MVSKSSGAAVTASAQTPTTGNAGNAGSSKFAENNTTELTGEEKDNLSRSNKKIKQGITDDVHMKENTTATTTQPNNSSHTNGQVSNNDLSYRDSLMTFSGAQQGQTGKEVTTWETLNLDIIEDIDDEIVEEGGEEDPTNPVITASKEERIEWSKPWRGSLIIKLMGRRIGFKKKEQPEFDLNKPQEENGPPTEKEPMKDVDPTYGPWMEVKKTTRRNMIKKDGAADGKKFGNTSNNKINIGKTQEDQVENQLTVHGHGGSREDARKGKSKEINMVNGESSLGIKNINGNRMVKETTPHSQGSRFAVMEDMEEMNVEKEVNEIPKIVATATEGRNSEINGPKIVEQHVQRSMSMSKSKKRNDGPKNEGLKIKKGQTKHVGLDGKKALGPILPKEVWSAKEKNKGKMGKLDFDPTNSTGPSIVQKPLLTPTQAQGSGNANGPVSVPIVKNNSNNMEEMGEGADQRKCGPNGNSQDLYESLNLIKMSQQWIKESGIDELASLGATSVLKKTRFLIHTRVTDRNKRMNWYTTAIYGSPQANLRKNLWDELREIASVTNGAWFLAGDFNAYLSPNDKQGRPKFTWGRQEVKERLDWAFTNQEGRVLFPDAHVTHLPELKSDHRPILISLNLGNQSEPGSRPFHFQAAWLSDNSFPSLIERSWCDTEDWSVNAKIFTEAVLGRSTCSNLWKGITRTWHLVQAHTSWNLGDGSQIGFWHDKWVSGLGKLIDHVHTNPPLIDHSRKVCEFVTASGGWNWGMIAPYVSNEVRKRIEALIPPHHSRRDCVKWDHEADGVFSVRSAYKAICGNNMMNNKSMWKKVWRSPVPERIRMFMWLLGHGKILTNSHRKHRHMTSDDTCPRCGRAEETILHAIRDCEDIKALWLRFVRPSYWEHFFSCNLVEWMEWNLKTDVGSDLAKDWRTGFGVICWQIWKNRNLLVFEDHTSNKDDLFFAAWFTISDIIIAAEQDKKPAASPKVSRMVRWIPPERDRITCNTDGSVLEGRDTAACGGVIRDCSGTFLLGYSRNLGSCSILWAELRGILEGLNLLWASGFRNVDVESDSKASINMIDQGVPSTHPCAALVYRIREVRDRGWDVRFRHVYREANKVADFVARLGHTLQHEAEMFTIPPVECLGLLAEDVKGIDPAGVCVA
ncbi:hypothetical protein G2W53_004923 [Senna tora]|uniref:RNase H type-1 domain-containing protein n=1 Tax=Senna tora TaxID=362788 RepID=A0A835CJR8_9FABA|nr:hypothetical protein G2W53_004923 [Senna tora]